MLSQFYLEEEQEIGEGREELLDTLSGTAQKLVHFPKNTKYILDWRHGAKYCINGTVSLSITCTYHLKKCKELNIHLSSHLNHLYSKSN